MEKMQVFGHQVRKNLGRLEAIKAILEQVEPEWNRGITDSEYGQLFGT